MPAAPDPLDRRAFLGRAAAAAAAAVALPTLPAALAAQAPTAAAAAGAGAAGAGAAGAGAAGGAAPGFALAEVTLGGLAEGLTSGAWTSRSVVEAYLARIAAVDDGPGGTNAILELNPDALAIADERDAERRAGRLRGPLHGVPVLVKDNIGTADRMHTSAGSLALAGSIAPRDAFVVERLREAGAVLLAKGNMSEWSDARGRDSVGGWSGRGRLTRNPYALDRSAGGSSSGAAVAVSANLVAAALGTETLGSIVSPAALCGIVGLKPTVGLVSRAGVIPVSYTQDTVGPMTRTVRDAALLLSAIAGPDPRDPATAAGARRHLADYTGALEADGLRGARIGLARNLFDVGAATERAIEGALDAMRAAGAVLVEHADIETAPAIWPYDAEVLSYELKASLNAYLASLGPDSPVRSLDDLIAFNEGHADRELGWFGQETFLYAQSRGGLDDPAYVQALAMVRELSRTRGIDATLAAHRLDAIVAPTQRPAWMVDVLNGDNTEMGSFLVPAAAGYPSLTVPAGTVAGLPVGLLFMGPAWSEATLLRLGYVFEQAVRARREPTLQATLPLQP